MDNRGKRQASSIFGGMGFYIALLVCVLAAGVVGYFALLNNGETPETQPDLVSQTAPVDQTDPGPAQSVAAPEEEPVAPVGSDVPLVVAKEPTIKKPVVREPESEPASAPIPEDPAPVVHLEDMPAEEEPVQVVSPLDGETIAVFSVDQLTYDATLGDWRTHDGIDIRAEAGTAVLSASAGTVLSVEEDGRLGATVVIDHGNGYVTTYASLQPEVSVLAGDAVDAGSMIGLVGNTSLTEAGLGAHLHFSVAKDGEIIDPAVYLGE